MSMKRTAGALISALLLGACASRTGIVDNFAPPLPQAQSDARAENRAEPVPADAAGGTTNARVGEVAPCVVESVAALIGSHTESTALKAEGRNAPTAEENQRPWSLP